MIVGKGTTNMTTIFVTYPSTGDATFDQSYYVSHHIPLVNKTWLPLGLASATAFFPNPAPNGDFAICECVFKDDNALQAALEAPDTAIIMEDVKNFTSIAPVIIKGISL